MSDIQMKILASKCLTCSRAVVPPREICPYCGKRSERMRDIELIPEGEVVSYTLLHMPPEGFEPPLLMALVRLEHDAVVLCLLEEGLEEPAMEVGTKVRISIDDQERLRFSPL
ncbi:hypothetical protein EU546_04130 [Candidatus Thorarchaeota archaeon]|nr:MAG: hypothetical protein EU546_04130 [Candidatus Thorarchaeota archaeon]